MEKKNTNSKWEIISGQIRKEKMELSIEINDYTISLIYDESANGYFCCIPQMGLGCVMGKPDAVAENTTYLQCTGMDEYYAVCIAEAICEYYNEYSDYAIWERDYKNKFHFDHENMLSNYDEILSLNLDTASENTLIRANILTISQLESMSDEEILALNHFGKTRLKRLREALRNRKQ